MAKLEELEAELERAERVAERAAERVARRTAGWVATIKRKIEELKNAKT